MTGIQPKYVEGTAVLRNDPTTMPVHWPDNDNDENGIFSCFGVCRRARLRKPLLQT